MQGIARILTANLAELRPGERAAAISCTGPGNEPQHECPRCMDSGWCRIDLPGGAGMRQCECIAERARMRALALIPERFRDASLDSFKPRDPRQERALSLMRKDPGGSWFLTRIIHEQAKSDLALRTSPAARGNFGLLNEKLSFESARDGHRVGCFAFGRADQISSGWKETNYFPHCGSVGNCECRAAAELPQDVAPTARAMCFQLSSQG
jgi:hypothetical protein